MGYRLSTRSADFARRFDDLLEARRGHEASVDADARAIVEAVRTQGFTALAGFTRRFDGLDITPETVAVPRAALGRALDACPRDIRAALELAARRIERWHGLQKPEDIVTTDAEGVTLALRWTPLASAGVYVPGGTAAYPSSVLMNVIPARVAGVEQIVMTTPASGGTTSGGHVHSLVLAAAALVGVDEVFTIGGAQAIAALAFGVAPVPRVDRIVGPGNAWVAAAKRIVFGQTGIDMVAGPSEILVLADDSADPDWTALDLLSQAEHDENSRATLITDSVAFGDDVEARIAHWLDALPRAATARASWDAHGAVIVVDALEDSLPLVARAAPEHVEVLARDPRALAARVRNAGAVFIGHATPGAVGDYVAGANHVLPTGQSARHGSGLSVFDFFRRTSVVECSPEGLGRIGPAAMTLARAEGFDAHAASIAIRIGRELLPAPSASSGSSVRGRL